MKLLYTTVLFLYLFLLNAVAQKSDANIIGHVESAETGEHLPFITVAIKGTTLGTATDATGHYFLKNLPEGKFTLVASSIGYQPEEKEIIFESSKTIEVNFKLKEALFNLNEVVVSATKNETNKKESPIIVNIASSKLFEGIASSNLAESMNFQPGLRVENNCTNCGIPQLRINGLDGQYSQILMDSRPIFSTLASVYGLEQLPVAMIERVEVVRGGGSSLFGASSIGGVVNIITKEPLNNFLSVSNTTNFFANGKADINTSVNGSFVSDDYKTGVYLFGMIKERDAYDHNKDGFSDIPKVNSETLGFKAYYRTSSYTKLTVEYHHINEYRRGGDNVDQPPHQTMIAEELSHKIDGGGLKYDIHTPDNKYLVSLYTSAQNINRNSYFGTNYDTNAYGKTDDFTYVGGGQATTNFEQLLFMPAELTGGIEYNYDNLNDVYLAANRTLKQKTNTIGGFLQNEWKTEQISILIGARIDKHNLMKKAVFSPRGNIRYSPNDKLGLRASYSSGYRAPQAYNEDLHVEAVGGTSTIIVLDPNLKPEYSHSISVSADYYHSFGKVQTNFLIEGFYTQLDDIFNFRKAGEDKEGNLIMERYNASTATIQGINLEAKIGLPGLVEIQMGYTIQNSRYKNEEQWSDDVKAQKRMFRTPDQYGYFTSFFNLNKRFKASIFGTYTGSMLVKHNAGYIEKDTEKKTPCFFDMGMKLSYNIPLKGDVNLELNGGIKNIFDSYQKDLDRGPEKDASYIYGPALPRMIFGGIKFSI